MNVESRKTINQLIERCKYIKHEIQGVESELETLKDDEQSKFDDMTEGLLAEAHCECDTVFQSLNTIISNLENARE